ncbi:MAG: hypothetical protein ACYTEK_22820 [Planctomycetota bacterium]|jgi:hypothetical protein
MSPRKNNVITIEAWPDPKKGKLYRGIVREAIKKTKHVQLTIENFDTTQLGRTHDVNLPLPVRPGNRTWSFFAACRIDVNTVGAKICLDDIVGITVGMRFNAVGEDGSQEVDFERIEDSQNKQTETSVEDPGDQSGQW